MAKRGDLIFFAVGDSSKALAARDVIKAIQSGAAAKYFHVAIVSEVDAADRVVKVFSARGGAHQAVIEERLDDYIHGAADEHGVSDLKVFSDIVTVSMTKLLGLECKKLQRIIEGQLDTLMRRHTDASYSRGSAFAAAVGAGGIALRSSPAPGGAGSTPDAMCSQLATRFVKQVAEAVAAISTSLVLSGEMPMPSEAQMRRLGLLTRLNEFKFLPSDLKAVCESQMPNSVEPLSIARHSRRLERGSGLRDLSLLREEFAPSSSAAGADNHVGGARGGVEGGDDESSESDGIRFRRP